jgi:predicted PurR-regulated permease PerM
VPPPLEWAAAMAWRLLLVAIVAYLAARLLARLRLVVVPLLAALLLTSLLGPPVEWLRRRGWPSLAATWTVLAAALLVLAGVLFLVTSRVVPQLGDLTVHLGDSLDRSAAGWSTGRCTCPTASSATSPAAWSRSWPPTGRPSSAGWSRPRPCCWSWPAGPS